MRRSIPRLVDGIHIPDPNVDKMVKGGVIERHVVGAMIKLVLMKSYQAPMVHQVVHGQPFLEDVTEVLLWVLRPTQGRINNL